MRSNPAHCALWLTEYHSPFDALCHGIVEVLYQKKTRYQEMLIVNSGSNGKALVLDGSWQACMGDEFLYHEPLVHPACLLQGDPQRVLILGGGDGAALREVLKWRSVKLAVLVDLDGEVVDACRQYLPEMHQGAFDDTRCEVVVADAFDYVDTRKQYWDVIVSDLTDPLQEGPSAKLFTHEYFARCRQALAPGGCFVLQAGLAGPSEMHIHTRLVRTVTGVFERVFHFASHVPTWASPMGFVIGTDRSVQWNDPDPGAVDALLARKIDGRLRMFDGRAFRGLMHPPKYLRDAVAAETEVFTLDNLPLSI